MNMVIKNQIYLDFLARTIYNSRVQIKNPTNILTQLQYFCIALIFA